MIIKKQKRRKFRDQNLETIRKLRSNKVPSKKFKQTIRQIIDEELEVLKSLEKDD